MRRLFGSLFLLIAAGLLSTAAAAYDDATFEKDVVDAYTSFRVAASYLRTDNPSIGGLELTEAERKWRDIAAKAATAQPPAYASDDSFLADIEKIQAILSEGLDMTDTGETRQAFDHLLGVRGILYDLRKRNGRRVYADCVTELNGIMADIIPLRGSPPDLSKPDGKTSAHDLFTDYRAKVSECEEMAPETYKSNEEFQRLFSSTGISADESLAAIERENQGELFRMLGEIISFDRIIFFRFGG